MTEKQRPKPEPPRPPKDFGGKAVELAASIGKTKQDLAKAAGRSGKPKVRTIDRLVKGEGSLALAHDVRAALKSWGLDISELPPLDDAGDPRATAPEWLHEWIDLGERLHTLATERRFAAEVSRIREVVVAHEIVDDDGSDADEDAEGLAASSKLAQGSSEGLPRYYPRRR